MPSLRYIVFQLRKVFSLRMIPAVSLFLLSEKMFGVGGEEWTGCSAKKRKPELGLSYSMEGRN